MKEAYSWSEKRFYIECPYCDEVNGGEEGDFDETVYCGKCQKEFKVIHEKG